jgi:serine/threonine protein kinase
MKTTTKKERCKPYFSQKDVEFLILKSENNSNDKSELVKAQSVVDLQKRKLTFMSFDYKVFHPSIFKKLKKLEDLCHPNLLKIHKVILREDITVLVTANYEGFNLFNWFFKNQKKLQEKYLVTIIRGILQVLEYMHDNLVYHMTLDVDCIQLTNINWKK